MGLFDFFRRPKAKSPIDQYDRGILGRGAKPAQPGRSLTGEPSPLQERSSGWGMPTAGVEGNQPVSRGAVDFSKIPDNPPSSETPQWLRHPAPTDAPEQKAVQGMKSVPHPTPFADAEMAKAKSTVERADEIKAADEAGRKEAEEKLANIHE